MVGPVHLRRNTDRSTQQSPYSTGNERKDPDAFCESCRVFIDPSRDNKRKICKKCLFACCRECSEKCKGCDSFACGECAGKCGKCDTGGWSCKPVDNPSNSPITYCNSMNYCSKCEALLCEKCWDCCLRCKGSFCTACMGSDSEEDRCDCCERICGRCRFRCHFCDDAICVDCGVKCACGKMICTGEECSSVVEEETVCKECKRYCSKCREDRLEGSLVLCVGCWKYVCEDNTDCWDDATKRCSSCDR